MNINELESLAKEWDRFDADNEYSQSFLELIAAYREAVASLKHGWSPYYINGIDAKKMADEVFDTAKRLGVE